MGVKHYKDGHRHCVSISREGHPQELSVYNDRRCAVTFPTSHNTGYYCLFGLKDVITHRDKLPLQLLSEAESTDQNKIYDKLTVAMRKYHCTHVYADCSKDFQSSEVEFGRFLEKRGIKWLSMYDASEFEGFNTTYAGFEAARAPIDEQGRLGLLEIPERSILRRQLKDYSMEDTKQDPARRFYALNAFNHIIMSYVLSPWVSPGKSHAMDRNEGYGG